MNTMNAKCRAVAMAALSLAVSTPSALAQSPAAAPAKSAATPAKLPPALARIRETGVVTIAHRPDASPFAYLDAEKRPIGYAIDLCNEIVELMRRDLKRPLRVAYVEVSAQSRFEVLRNGRADMECGTTINDPARRRAGTAYSMPYFFAGPRILAKANSPVREFHDLAGRRVVVVKGTNSVPMLRSRLDRGTLPSMQLSEVASYSQAFNMIRDGEADAFVTLDVLHYGMRANSEDPRQYKVAGNYQLLEPVALILPSGDKEFKQYVDRHLGALMIDGVVGKLYAKWYLSPIAPHGRPLEMPMSPLLRDQLRWPTDRAGDE